MPFYTEPLRASPSLAFEPVRARTVWRTAIYLAATSAAILTCTMPRPVAAAEDNRLGRLAICKDSWFDWKGADRRMAEYINDVQDRMTPKDDGQSYTPPAGTTVLGLPVREVFPQSIGSGVGFSVLAAVDFERAKRAFEKELGKPMTCATSDGVPGCTLQVGDKKTVTLLGGGRGSSLTLAGCYYFYQQ